MEIDEILRQIQSVCQSALRENLIGVYVHGSLAMGCFRWASGDVDFLVVVKETPLPETKRLLMAQLLELDEKCPPAGMEMSVVLAQYCRRFVHPAPYELHFSHAHVQRARADLFAYCREMHGVDPDLAAHFTVTRARGICLCGEPIESLFAPVPKEVYLDSICRDVEQAEQEIAGKPVYMTLNLCRVLACLRDGSVLSKREGGKWGEAHVPQVWQEIVRRALAAYSGGGEMLVPEEQLRAFARFMLGEIARYTAR